MVLGCLLIAAVTLMLPQRELVDAELVFLLQGMAVIKAGLLLGAFAAVYWRFCHPTAPRMAMSYSIGLWMATAATFMIWQLTWIPAAALLFHLGEILMLVTAWRDERITLKALTASRHRQPQKRPAAERADPPDLADAA